MQLNSHTHHEAFRRKGRLYLVFEYLDQDLKKHMDSVPGGMSPQLIKVRPSSRGCSSPGPPFSSKLSRARFCRATCSR